MPSKAKKTIRTKAVRRKPAPRFKSKPNASYTRMTQDASGAILLSGEELWNNTVANSGPSLGIGVASKLFTPGSSGLTRLDEIASLYEQYQLKRARIKYCPGVGTTIDGRIRYGVDYVASSSASPVGNLPTSPGDVDKLGGNNHALYTAGTLVVNVGTAMKQKWMYVGSAGLDKTAFALSFSNESLEGAPGEFRVEYEILLKGVGSGGGGGGGFGSLSGTFVQATSLTGMHIDTAGFGSAKWGTIDHAACHVGFNDGAVIPDAVAFLRTDAPVQAARQTGPDGASVCISDYKLLLGTGIALEEGSTYTVEVEVQASAANGANGEKSPAKDSSSGTAGFVPTQWILCPDEGSGDESQVSALDNCPFRLAGANSQLFVDQELTLVRSGNRDGLSLTSVPNSAGPDPENPNRLFALWVGQVSCLVALAAWSHSSAGGGTRKTSP